MTEVARPDFVIRGESVVTSLCRQNTILVTGSEEGNIKLYDTQIMRPTASWIAHKGLKVYHIYPSSDVPNLKWFRYSSFCNLIFGLILGLIN